MPILGLGVPFMILIIRMNNDQSKQLPEINFRSYTERRTLPAYALLEYHSREGSPNTLHETGGFGDVTRFISKMAHLEVREHVQHEGGAADSMSGRTDGGEEQVLSASEEVDPWGPYQ